MRSVRSLLVALVLGCWVPAVLVAQQKEPVKIAAEVKTVEPFSYVALECSGPYTQYAQAEATYLAELKSSGIKTTGVQMTFYLNSPLYVKQEELKWDVGHQLAEDQAAAGKLTIRKFDFAKVAEATHRGPYATTYQTINALYAWIGQQGLKSAGGPCVERYLDPDPSKVPDDQKVTVIWIPVQ
ncbi:MAG: GyrI-like domain-containing protein [Candidatus Riflebacteria bacterium]|nr:GyrI-like domain-containing protein [Candidatus Riflebacteria bacterium]